jgi:ribosome biogenesis GTPase
MDLTDLGWNETFAAAFAEHAARGLEPARVAVEHKLGYRLYGAGGEIDAGVSGRFRHRVSGRPDYPAVGDWVAVRRGPDGRLIIDAVLERRSKFSRRAAGHGNEEQIVAANVDVVFLVSGLDQDFNLRRIERYLVVAWDSGARPVVVLNKSDLRPDVAAVIEEVERVAAGVPVHAVSSRPSQGLEALRRYLTPGVTAALLGSSGVGKSTIINELVGREVRATREVRAADSKGRHTTTRRELLLLPGGGLVIDTPGMRELQLREGVGGFEEGFADIGAQAAGCRFRDCRHLDEPGCAVKAAVDSGELPAERLASYQKLQRERDRQAAEQDRIAASAEKRRVKSVHRAARAHKPRG